tara:strand:+ start:879 stop:1262 length:384 start_codon:yes stop_codon:yes gene_type:complete
MIDWSQSKDPRSTKQLIEDGMRVMQETIVIPNEWLPEGWHDNVRGGRTLARLNEMCEDVESGDTKHQKLKALKAENCENYRKQYEANESFEYNGHRNEMRLHKNEMAFVGGMVSSGMISKEDLEDEI